MKLHELELARKAQQQSDKHFYFDDSGSILYYGRSESDEYVQSHHAVLSYEQCKIIEETDKTMNDFIVVIDTANEGVYTLVNKQIELESFKSATSMLSIVKKKTALTSAYDIKIEYTPADPLVNLIVSINEKLRSNVTKNMDINNFTFKGVGFINLYFTTANDPHFMFDSIKVDLIKLFKEGKQVYKVSSELADCDLFTKKIFDKYEYKVTT
jgi:hypothetical protein